MRILFDARRAVSRATGIGRMIDGLLGALVQEDRQNSYLVLHGERNPLPAGAPANFERRQVDLPLNSLAATWAIPKLAREWSADVAYFPFWLAPPFMPCPFVVAVHDLLYSHYPEYLPLARRYFHDYYTALVVRTASRIHTLAADGRKDLTAFFQVPVEKVDIVSPDVDPTYRPRVLTDGDRDFIRGLGLSKPFFLYVGNQRPHKNLGRLLEAYRKIAAETESDLAIVGTKGTTTDPYAQPFAAGVTDLLAAHRLHLLGQIDDLAKLSIIYNAARGFVFPTLHEGFGLPALEAMRCGTPVVCSNATSLPEVVGDAAVTVDPRQVREIAEAMARVDRDAALRADLSARGLVRAERFSWRRSAHVWLESLQQTAGK